MKTNMFGLNWQKFENVVNPLRTLLTGVYTLLLFVLVCLRLFRGIRSKDLIWIAVIGCFLISYTKTRNNILLIASMFVIAADGIFFNTIVDTYFYSGLISLSFILLCHYFGLSSDRVITWSYGTGHSLGTSHPNVLAVFVMTVFFSWFFKYHNRIKRIILVITTILVSFLLWKVTLSRTSVILILALPALVAINETIAKVNPGLIMRWSKYIVLGIVSLTCGAMIYYRQIQNVHEFDATMMSRFSSANDLLKQYGLHLFGSHIEFVSSQQALLLGTRSVILDTAYLALLINHGIVPTLIVLVAIYKIIKKCYKLKKPDAVILVILFLVHGIMELSVLMIRYDFLIFLLSAGFLSEDKLNTKNV